MLFILWCWAIWKCFKCLNVRRLEVNNTAEAKISEPENTAIESFQNDIQREKKLEEHKNMALLACQTISHDLTHFYLESRKEREWDWNEDV